MVVNNLLSPDVHLRFVYRHSWSPGDVLLCDNRSCVHRGRPWDDPNAKRMICLVKIAEGTGRDICLPRKHGETKYLQEEMSLPFQGLS